MSDLAAAAAALGAPEELVERSATARAVAMGTTVTDVLSAWAGGAAPVAAAAAPSPPEPAAPVAQQAAEQVAEPVAAIESPVAIQAPVAVMVETPIEEDPIDPVPLSTRIATAGRFGVRAGLLAGLVTALFSSQWLLPRASVVGESGAFEAAIEVTPNWVIVGSVLMGIAFGLAIAGITRSLTSLRDPAMRLTSPAAVTGLVGGVSGAVLGAGLGAVVLGSGQASALNPEVTVIPVAAALAWTVLGWMAAGWLIAAATQMFGVPAGVDSEAAEETSVIRRRLVSGFGIPVVAAATIATFVLPLAWVFIQFPGFAPLVGVFVAAAIVGFAGLAASRPGMRITTGEFFVAFAGIAVVVLILVSVLLVQGGGHGEAGEEPLDEASFATSLIS